MDRAVLENILAKIQGCTFASLDAETEVSPGITHVVKGKRVILFTNQKGSGYEKMVKRRLLEAGKDPDSFSSGELPWGVAVPNSPLVEHKGRTYLKAIDLAPPVSSKYFVGGVEVDPDGLMLREPHHISQGLPPSDQVKVSCYKLENIKRIALMGEELVSNGRSILRINA